MTVSTFAAVNSEMVVEHFWSIVWTSVYIPLDFYDQVKRLSKRSCRDLQAASDTWLSKQMLAKLTVEDINHALQSPEQRSPKCLDPSCKLSATPGCRSGKHRWRFAGVLRTSWHKLLVHQLLRFQGPRCGCCVSNFLFPLAIRSHCCW